MKAFSFLAVVVVVLICTFFFQSCVHWGYNGGPSYKKITTDNIRYICGENKFRLKNLPTAKASMYCYQDSRLIYQHIFNHKDTLKKDGFLKLPDDIAGFTKVPVLVVQIIIDERDYYDFIISKEACVNDTISGSIRVY